MFQIGESLREARTRRGLTTADVQKDLRLRERYLNALEEERWDQLPGEAYVKGFLRMYAEHLGLNGNLYIDEYNSRFAGHDEDPPPIVAEPSVRRRPSRGIMRTLVGIVAVCAVVVGISAWRLGGSPANSSNGEVQTPVVAKTASAAPVVATPAAAPKAKPPVAQTSAFAVLTAPNGRCWVQVRAGGPSGALLFQGTLAPGITKKFSVVDHTVWVRMGNPLAMAITVAGQPVSGLGASPLNLLLTQQGAKSA